MNEKSLSLEEIDIYSGTQTRVSTNDEAVEGYAEAMLQGASFPPVIVFFDGAKHYLADGFHRYLAAKKIELRDLQAEVREGTRGDALIHALGANATNGVYRTNADKRNAVEIALEEWTDRSNAYLADICKVSIELVRRIRKQLGLDNQDVVLGRDGKKYPSKKPGDSGSMTSLEKQEASLNGGGDGGGSGGGKPSKKNANYNDAAGGGSMTELENEAREMIRNGEMDPRELATLPSALPTDYVYAAVNLFEKMDAEDPRYDEALDKLEAWIAKKRSSRLASTAS
ncbi:MAG: chromosome partitioning protein ParB [Opitutales bacterium TMED158]|nr:MAG: chromosome partitioning protein ParB [Opitutales bacterium TMED158]